MKGLKPEERWAQAMIRAALSCVVDQHDDGSRPGMHDLDIYRDGRACGAVEITAAADEACVELWNLMNGGTGRWVAPGIGGGWLVSVLPSARANTLRRALPLLLAELERREIRSVRVRGREEGLACDLRRLGVTYASRSRTDCPGSIYMTITIPRERRGGVVAATGDRLAEWVGTFLASEAGADVRRKLAASGRAEGHAFVFVPGFTTADFTVSDLLMRPGAPLPTLAPVLPDGMTHVWIVSTWDSGSGFRWSESTGWVTFDKHVDIAA